MSTAVGLRVARLAAVALTLTFVTPAAIGCRSPGPGSSAQRPAETSVAPTPSRSFGFDVDATIQGVPSSGPDIQVSLPSFPPSDTDGLRPVADVSQVRLLERVAAESPQFWIQRSGSPTLPAVIGKAARDVLTAGGGFSAATIVPVLPLKLTAHTAPVFALGDASGYQVYLQGAVGSTSFGLRPGLQAGTWLLDSRGELANWPTALSALKHDPGYEAKSAAVTHTAYAAEGSRALYLSWVVFSDAAGRKRVSLLRDLPPTGDQWKLEGQPLKTGVTYPPGDVFGIVSATPR